MGEGGHGVGVRPAQGLGHHLVHHAVAHQLGGGDAQRLGGLCMRLVAQLRESSSERRLWAGATGAQWCAAPRWPVGVVCLSGCKLRWHV